jgi:lipoprotein-releasing system ATP-binding protein
VAGVILLSILRFDVLQAAHAVERHCLQMLRWSLGEGVGLRAIGFVFQFHYLLPEFTCLENVMIPALKLNATLNRYSPEEIRQRALDKLDLLGVKEQAEKRASKLSGGQQQRVAIARALINDPTIIMGDEPTGNLDSANTNIAFDIFRDLCRNHGQTLICVTHDKEFAMNTDRTIEMSDGRIISGN